MNFGFGAKKAEEAPLQRLTRLTGLHPTHAEKCLKLSDSCFFTALASFVQTLPNSLPPAWFADPNSHKVHAAEINAILRETYGKVRSVTEKVHCAERDAWEALRDSKWNTADSTAVLINSAKQEADEMKSAAAPAIRYLDAAEHFTGSFLEMETFWKEEVEERAPLLNKNNGFLQRNRGSLRDRLLKWYKIAGAFHAGTPIRYVAMDDEDHDIGRVIIKDSVRTFFADVHRKKFTNFLWAMYHEFGDYAQSMSYLAGLCLLGLTEQETVAVLRKVAKEYIPKHWAAEAIGFATNAWVIESLMKKRMPDIAEHFNSLNFWPDTYLQKILCGLCVHVLEFDDLFEFLDAFMQEGFPWLVKFVFAVIDNFRAQLMSVKTAERMGELHEIMRLDQKVVGPDDIKRIMKRAKSIDLGDSLSNLDLLRMTAFNDKVEPRLARAPKTEAFEPCELCNKNKPVWFCESCGTICSTCHQKNLHGHLKQHTVEKY